MAVGDLLTGPWQVELRSILMDGCGPTCPALVITDPLDGLGVPSTRNADKARPQQHGLFASPQYLDGRPLRWKVAAVGVTVASVRTLLSALGTAMAPVVDTDSDLVIPLAFTLEAVAQKYLVFGKPQRVNAPKQTMALTYDEHHGQVAADGHLCEFLATDPAIYGLTLHTASTGLGSSSGGLAFPFAFPFSFGSASPGTIIATNAGNFPTLPTLIITAGGSGLSGIRVLNVTTGLEWSITITLSAGDVLTVNMQDGTALLNGAASRDNLVNRPPSAWWSLQPGANTIQFIGSGAGSTCEIDWRDAWDLV